MMCPEARRRMSGRGRVIRHPRGPDPRCGPPRGCGPSTESAGRGLSPASSAPGGIRVGGRWKCARLRGDVHPRGLGRSRAMCRPPNRPFACALRSFVSNGALDLLASRVGMFHVKHAVVTAMSWMPAACRLSAERTTARHSRSRGDERMSTGIAVLGGTAVSAPLPARRNEGHWRRRGMQAWPPTVVSACGQAAVPRLGVRCCARPPCG